MQGCTLKHIMLCQIKFGLLFKIITVAFSYLVSVVSIVVFFIDHYCAGVFNKHCLSFFSFEKLLLLVILKFDQYGFTIE